MVVRQHRPSMSKLWPRSGVSEMQKPIPTREAFGEVLAELGKEFTELVVVDCDISKGTRTVYFAKAYPERYINFGIAEQNAMCAAAGLALEGKLPLISTYAVFASMRAVEQIRTFICYDNLNVKIAVSHGGMNPSTDGVTHQASEDLGMLTTIPNLTVVAPADYYATRVLTRAALAWQGPVYLRFSKDPVPLVYTADDTFAIGKGKVLRDGSDVTLISNGDMLPVAVEAADMLAAQGVSVQLIDMHTVKPLDRELVLAAAQKTRRIVTIEDHQIHGGLGGAVAELLGEERPTPMRRIGLRDTFAESGPFNALLKKYHMDADAIVLAARELLGK